MQQVDYMDEGDDDMDNNEVMYLARPRTSLFHHETRDYLQNHKIICLKYNYSLDSIN